MLDSAFISGVLPIFDGQPLLMHVYVFTHVGDFQEWSPAADWLRDDYLRLDTLFCVQLRITYSTVGTAKCVCIFLNTNVF